MLIAQNVAQRDPKLKSAMEQKLSVIYTIPEYIWIKYDYAISFA
jgi:hypothetical protein